MEAHHAGLRLRFVRRGQAAVAPGGSSETAAGWEQRIASPGVTMLSRHDRSALPADRWQASLRDLAAELQGGLDIRNGPVWRAALINVAPGSPACLLLTAHHLVIDALSWRVLTEDLAMAYCQIADGEPVSLPPTVPFSQWVARLAEHAHSGAFGHEVAYWLDQLGNVLVGGNGGGRGSPAFARGP